MNADVKYWIACSGGVDSTVLVHLFHQMDKSFGILHCNFQLRGEASDEDEAFVLNLANELNVPIRTKKFDTSAYKKERNLNTQLAARELRYKWFNEIITSDRVEICLAHHRDDQVETFLLQLRRGAKVRGLCAMPKSKDGFVRPLLGYTKSELIDLARINKWNWREDVSNRSNDYKRNLYRNELIPQFEVGALLHIKELIDAFQKLLRQIKGFNLGFMNSYGGLEFEIQEWKSYPVWLKQFIISKKSLGKFPVHEIEKLCLSESGASFKNEPFSVWKWKSKLVFYEKTMFKVQLKIDLIKKTHIDFKKDILYLDMSKVKGNLRLRKKLEDDKFIPLGMGVRKTVSRFLKDKAVPPYFREEVVVVTDDSNKVVAVHDLSIEDYYKIDEKTEGIYAISLIVK